MSQNEDFKPGDAVSVKGYRGVAFTVHSHPKVWEPLLTCETDEHEIEWPLESEDGEWIEVSDRWICVMVGDDKKHEFAMEDLSHLPEDEFCRECGQIGCYCGNL